MKTARRLHRTINAAARAAESAAHLAETAAGDANPDAGIVVATIADATARAQCDLAARLGRELRAYVIADNPAAAGLAMNAAKAEAAARDAADAARKSLNAAIGRAL